MKQNTTERPRRKHKMLNVEILTDVGSLRDLWCHFQRTAMCGPHDTWEWNDAWVRTAGKHDNPYIAIGRNASGEIVFILPLAIRQRMGCQVLEWLGSDQGNYASGLFHPTAWSDSSMPRDGALLKSVLAGLPKIDAVHLEKQPETLGTFRSPLAGLLRIAEASSGHSFPLGENWEDHFNDRFSSSARSKLRRDERRIADNGEVSYKQVSERQDKLRFTDQVITQKSDFFAERGIRDFFQDEGMRDFLRSLAQLPEENSDLSARLYTCHLDGELLAAKMGVVHNNTYYGMISSTTDGAIRRYGPGSVLFRYSVQFMGEEGIERLDCGAGEDDTKKRWCTKEHSRLHLIAPVSARGYAYVAVLCAQLKAKLFIKNNPEIWSRYKRARAWLACYLKPKSAECREETTSNLRVQT